MREKQSFLHEIFEKHLTIRTGIWYNNMPHDVQVLKCQAQMPDNLTQRVFVRNGRFESEVLFMFAIIVTGGKQYKVNEGDVVFVEKLDVAEGETVTFDQVLALSKNDAFVMGTPCVEGATVTANVVKNGKAKKIHVLKYKAKKNEKKKIGHRQPYTKVQIVSING